MRVKIIICSLFLALPLLVQAGPLTSGLDKAGGGAGSLSKGEGSSASRSLAMEAGRITGAILSFLGIIFLALTIAGGLIWMTAGGNEKKIATARTMLIAAVVGLIIVLAAYAVTTFLADNLTAK